MSSLRTTVNTNQVMIFDTWTGMPINVSADFWCDCSKKRKIWLFILSSMPADRWVSEAAKIQAGETDHRGSGLRSGSPTSDRVSICLGDQELSGRMPETRGKAQDLRVFRFLRDAVAEGQTSLEQVARTFVAQNKRRGLAVVVSDLYDPAGFERGINVLRFGKFDVLVIHMTDEKEAKPGLAGDVLVYDCETGEEREVTVTNKMSANTRARTRNTSPTSSDSAPKSK